MDFSEIKSQEAAKRAMLIALAGNHSIVLIGPSGHGKSMLANAARKINPKIDVAEMTSGDPSSFAARSREHADVDLHVEVPPVPWGDLIGKRVGTASSYITKQIKAAAKYTDLMLSDTCLYLAKQAYQEMGLSARAYFTAIRVARTIANLEQSEKIAEMHLAEAVQYRLLDRKF